MCAGEAPSGEAIEDWEVLDVLTSLADKSLVTVETKENSTRYHLLETMRQYSRDRLMESGEGEAVRGRHRGYSLELVENAVPKPGESEHVKLNRLETEHDNLRTALEWCEAHEGDAEMELRFVAVLGGFWNTRGYLREGMERLTQPLARTETLGARGGGEERFAAAWAEGRR